VNDVSTRAAEIVASLTELSSEIRRVVLADSEGDVLAGSLGEEGGALAHVGAELLAHAPSPVSEGAAVEHVVVAAANGAVFAVRLGPWLAVATTTPEPAEALVLHDLRTCLRRLDEPQARRKRRRAKAQEPADA
jgi:hypothetical protein